MEVSVTQENLARALSAVGRVASSKSSLPILSNILLRTEGSRLLIAATNLEIASTYYIGAKITKPGSITLPSRLVSDFIASLPKRTVHLSTKGAHINITSGNYSSTIHGIESDEFPELPVIDEKKSVHYSLVTSDFKQSVSQTIFACSNDSTRPILTGAYWHSFEGSLYLAATDGYRLAEKKIINTKSDISAIVPASSLQEVLRSLNDSSEVVDVLFDETQVRFRVGEAEITSRLIDGKYPDYRQLIPKKSDNTATLDQSEFHRTVKIAGLFARESGGSITVGLDNDQQQVAINSVASEVGENSSNINGVVVGAGCITLNSRYLAEALGVIDADSVIIRFSGKLSPFTLSAVDKDVNYIHIIMPLKS